jgi:hypothetical protein
VSLAFDMAVALRGANVCGRWSVAWLLLGRCAVLWRRMEIGVLGVADSGN